MHITERYRRLDLGHLEIEFTDEILEYVCTENERDLEHMVAK